MSSRSHNNKSGGKKSSNKLLKDHKHNEIDQQNQQQLPQKSSSSSSTNIPKPEYVSQVQIHPRWPELPSGQGELFFECTLFLYSILALFLQYLNLYKTLWWLPKSYWPGSFKIFLFNPYLLSCIGLMLGFRVTKCFWNCITEMFVILNPTRSSAFWTVIEYGILKTPICTMVLSSFVFSFSRVYLQYSFKALFYFGIPLLAYFFLLWTGFDGINEEDKVQHGYSENSFIYKIMKPFFNASAYISAIRRSNALMDLDTVAHLCTNNPRQNRAEANELARDFFNRLKYSIFAGLSIGYFSIYLSCVFLPDKSEYGMPQYLLINNAWIMQLFIIVSLTSFSVYFTYLIPLPYFDLLQKSVFHLGHWEQLESTPDEDDHVMEYSEDFPYPYMDKQIISHKGQFYKAVATKSCMTVAALPGDATQFFFFRIANDPVRFVTLLCVFEFSLILFQFWLLVLTTDWQHIVTLVLLMFANYLLLGKLFKDRIVIGRIVKPSPEDISLWTQLLNELKSLKAKSSNIAEPPKASGVVASAAVNGKSEK